MEGSVDRILCSGHQHNHILRLNLVAPFQNTVLFSRHATAVGLPEALRGAADDLVQQHRIKGVVSAPEPHPSENDSPFWSFVCVGNLSPCTAKCAQQTAMCFFVLM